MKKNCKDKALWCIIDGTPEYDHDTYSCEKHISSMLSDSPYQTLTRLDTDTTMGCCYVEYEE